MIRSLTSSRWLGWIRTGSAGKPSGRRSSRLSSGKSRSLRLEALEQRALLSVTTLSEGFKEFDFTGTVNLSGRLDYWGVPVSYSGKANLDGHAVYTSPTEGTIDVGATGQGTYNALIQKGPFTFTGEADIVDNNGKMSGSGFGEIYVPDLGEMTGGGSASGQLNTPSLTILVNVVDEGFSLRLSGSFTPEASEPFGVSVTPTWNADPIAEGIDVSVEVEGPVHKARSHTTPVTNVKLYWASGESYANRVGWTSLADKIPIYWNQASGEYQILNLPTPPAKATHLLFVTEYDGKRVTSALELPELPSVSINDIEVAEGNKGTTNALFTVTLSEPIPFPVTVSYATASGTARSYSDFRGVFLGKVTFAPGETEKSISVGVIGDTRVEPDETFFVRLKSPKGATLGDAEGRGTILNDDVASLRSAALASYFSSMQQPRKDAAILPAVADATLLQYPL